MKTSKPYVPTISVLLEIVRKHDANPKESPEREKLLQQIKDISKEIERLSKKSGITDLEKQRSKLDKKYYDNRPNEVARERKVKLLNRIRLYGATPSNIKAVGEFIGFTIKENQ